MTTTITKELSLTVDLGPKVPVDPDEDQYYQNVTINKDEEFNIQLWYKTKDSVPSVYVEPQQPEWLLNLFIEVITKDMGIEINPDVQMYGRDYT